MALPTKSLFKLFSASLVLLFTVFCQPLISGAAEEQNEKNLEPEQALSLISAYSWTNTLPRELIDLQNEVETTADLEVFGASSLDFELRVWISDFNDKLIVLSELNQEIENEFSSAGIEIPFPQSDLHLRSVDKEVIAKLSDQKPSA